MASINHENSHAMFQNDFSLHVLNQETLLLTQLKVMWKKTRSFVYNESESLTIIEDSTNYEIYLILVDHEKGVACGCKIGHIFALSNKLHASCSLTHLAQLPNKAIMLLGG